MNERIAHLIERFSPILIMFCLFMSCSCTAEKKPPPPSLKQYEQDTKLMMELGKKFIDESDPQKLHEVAVATQQTRVMSCFDYNNECRLYGELVTKVIDASSDGTVTPAERQGLLNALAGLRSAVDEGISKLQREH